MSSDEEQFDNSKLLTLAMGSGQVTKTHAHVLNMLNTWKVVATKEKCQMAEVDVMTL